MPSNNPPRLTNLKWWAIDFDGTIAYSHPVDDGRDWVVDGPSEGIREFLYWVKSLGKKIVVHTARGSEDYILIEQFMQEHDLPFDMIWPGKLLAEVYIDDRAVEFKGNWDTVKRRIKRNK